jgi:hypothetical protein
MEKKEGFITSTDVVVDKPIGISKSLVYKYDSYHWPLLYSTCKQYVGDT